MLDWDFVGKAVFAGAGQTVAFNLLAVVIGKPPRRKQPSRQHKLPDISTMDI
jgi:hypothetical protein